MTVKHGSTPYHVLRVLEDADAPLSPEAVRDRLPVTLNRPADVNTALNRMYRATDAEDVTYTERLVERAGTERGPTGPRYTYRPTDAGRRALREAEEAEA